MQDEYGYSNGAPVVSGDGERETLPPNYVVSGSHRNPGYGTTLTGLRSPDRIDPSPMSLVDMQITDSVGVPSLPPEMLARLQARMSKVGLMSSYAPGTLDDNTIAAFQQLHTYANQYKVADLDMLRQMERGFNAAEKQDLLGDAFKPYTDVNVSKSVNLTDPQTAKAIARQAFADRLGREPSDSEFADFLGQLNATEQDHPTVTKTVTRVTGPHKSSSKTTTSGDKAPDPSVFADEYLRQDDLGTEANTREVGVDFFQEALSALGPGGGMLQ